MNANQNAELARHTINLLMLKAGKYKTNKLIFTVEDRDVINEVKGVLAAEYGTPGALEYYSESGLYGHIFTVFRPDPKINKK